MMESSFDTTLGLSVSYPEAVRPLYSRARRGDANSFTTHDDDAHLHPHNLAHIGDDSDVWSPSGSVVDEGTFSSSQDDNGAYTYRLRTSARIDNARFCTWVDKDASGTYDPNERPSRPQLRRRKSSTAHSTDRQRNSLSQNSALVQRQKRLYRSATAASDHGSSFVFTFLLDSERAKALLSRFPDTWPSDPHKRIDTLERDLEHCCDTEIRDESSSRANHIRRQSTRGSKRACQSKEYANLRQATSEPDRRPDLTGHPAARGCWSCVDLNLRCPLLDEPAAWPCQSCFEDDEPCELVVQPKRKRKCESCKEDRRSCSYDRLADFTLPCLECRSEGFRCVAGPTEDAVPFRISYENGRLAKPPCVPMVEQDTTSCAQCIINTDTRCSRSDTDGTAPCVSCEMQGLSCTMDRSAVTPIASLPSSRRRAGIGMSHKKRRPPPKSPSQVTVPSNEEGHTRNILTKLCHPVSFNVYDARGIGSCHFCSIPTYSILGLGAREVEVIEWGNAQPSTEVYGGHLGEGHESTRLCTDCTTARLMQLVCNKHNIRPSPAMMASDLDFTGAFNRLLSSASKSADHWCSICPALAMYRCAGSDDTSSTDGCGLLLCEACAIDLEQTHSGEMQAFLGTLPDVPTESRPFGLRADAELLRTNGPLARYMQHSLQ